MLHFLIFLLFPELCLFFMSTLSPVASPAFPGYVNKRSICLLCLGSLSDIVVRRFAQRLPQSDLQGHEGPDCNMEEDLPHVPQFIQIHVGQTDQCKRQEGFTVPPDREVGKQVALIQTGCCAEEEGNHIIKVLIVIL